MYHRVLPEADELTGEVDAVAFDAQMGALRSCFNVVPLAEAVDALASGTLKARTAAVTFDDGYADNVEIALPTLRRHGLNATFFIATGFLNGGRMFNDSVIEAIRRMPGPMLDLPAAGLWGIPVRTVAERRTAVSRVLKAVKHLPFEQRAQAVQDVERAAAAPLPSDLMMTSEQVLALARAGMDIGGHTVNHPILTRIGVEHAAEEIKSNREALRAIVGKSPTIFAYPNGVPGEDYSAAHVALVRQCGYRAAVSTSWGAATQVCDVYQLPRFTPWDRDPKRFVMRLLHNLLARKPVVLGPALDPLPVT
jgi:peptidoglycan/xylan/chitin deacetylase (PgdA/CDA1 family)